MTGLQTSGAHLSLLPLETRKKKTQPHDLHGRTKLSNHMKQKETAYSIMTQTTEVRIFKDRESGGES